MEVLYVYRGKDRSSELQHILGSKHRIRTLLGPLHKKIDTIRTDDVKILTTFVDSLLDEQTLSHFPKLKCIASRSTGTDHIDLTVCKERNITVMNVPGYGSSSVGELAMLLLLGIARNLKASLHRTAKGNFERSEDRGFELQGKTLGVIGTGAIGAYVAKLGKGFGMNINLYDISPNKKLAEELGATYSDTLEHLLSSSDVVSVHLPLLPATRHLLSYEELAQMKRGAVLINTARGGIVYAPALLEALQNDHLYGAGLDVLELEQYLYSNSGAKHAEHRSILRANRKLMHHPKILHTLHLGAQTEEAGDRIFQTTTENIASFLSKQPKNIVQA